MDTCELALLEGIGIVEEMSEQLFFFRSETVAENPCPGCVKGAPGRFLSGMQISEGVDPYVYE